MLQRGIFKFKNTLINNTLIKGLGLIFILLKLVFMTSNKLNKKRFFR